MADPELRAIPPVHAVVDATLARNEDLPRPLVTTIVRALLDEQRARLRATGTAPQGVAALAERCVARARAALAPTLRGVINATGIVIHTGLGRAPLPASAAAAAAEAARAYVPVELDLAEAARGRRADHVRAALCALTGAEDATVVNNNAAALLLTLVALAHGRSVIVSRGELVEIGGSFRLPDVMASSGCALREVGTTNRTRVTDYEGAIDETTAVLLKVHPSNFRVQGFTESVATGALVEVGRRRGIPVVDDIGSGALVPTSVTGWPSVEPDATSSIRAGADVVLFSGDKLLGGPQAGIIVGRRDLVQRIEGHPMMRALRMDKIRLAALAATLAAHRDPDRAARSVPVLAALTVDAEAIRARCEQLADSVRGAAEAAGVQVRVEPVEAQLGGGAMPLEALPSHAVVLEPAGGDEDGLARRLRLGEPAVLGTVRDGAVRLDLRAVPAEDDDRVRTALLTALR